MIRLSAGGHVDGQTFYCSADEQLLIGCNVDDETFFLVAGSMIWLVAGLMMTFSSGGRVDDWVGGKRLMMRLSVGGRTDDETFCWWQGG